MLRQVAGLVAAALLLGAVAVGVGGREDEGAEEETAVVINPLTGLAAPEPALMTLNPVLAKVSNSPAGVRPQAGLEAADLVFEHYTEGGLTRFSAIFHGERPERVGSIRSARLIDLELLPMAQGLLAWSGASIGVEELLQAGGHAERMRKGVLYRWPLYWRDLDIPAPHNMFVNVAALGALAQEEGVSSAPALRGLQFEAQAPDSESDAARRVEVRYRAASAGWVYDADVGAYLRYTDGERHDNAADGRQLQAANVIVIYAEHRETEIVESVWQGVTHYSLEIDLSGGGEGLLFRDGRMYPLRWERPEAMSLPLFSDMAGEPLALKPGKSWLQVLPPPAEQRRVEGVRVERAGE